MSNNNSTFNVCHRASAWITQSWFPSWKQAGWCPAYGGASGVSSKPWGKQLWKPKDLLSTTGMLEQEYRRKQRSGDAIVQPLQQPKCIRWQDTERSGNGRQGETSWIRFAIWCRAAACSRIESLIWFTRSVGRGKWVTWLRRVWGEKHGPHEISGEDLITSPIMLFAGFASI